MYNIAVLGCGAIGLTSALSIQKKLGVSCKITIFTKDISPNTTSDVAAGLWLPYLVENTPEDKLLKWSKLTKNYITELWKQGKAKEAGISLQLIIHLTDEKNYKTPKWLAASLGYSILTKKQLQYFGSGKDFSGGFALVSFIWEGSKFLPFLQKQFISNGGKIEMSEIKNFEQLSNFDVIVNCTGLQSKFLVPDFGVQPIRGQIIRVSAPWQYHTLITEYNNNSTYIIPNQDCVILGGTHQYGDFNLKINESDKKDIFERCSEILPSFSNCDIIKDCVGLRPGRNSVRLELENRTIEGGKSLKIVHNYGHGGCGITLSVGCALDTVELVSEALKSINKCKL